MKAIGTKVIADDSFSTRAGKVTGHLTNRWGTFHVVAMNDGTTEEVGHIMDVDGKGIGWKVATEKEVARADRYAAAN